MGDFIGFLISLSIAIGVGVNIANINVSEKDFQEPLKLCSTNEGLKRITFQVFNDPTVTCINGAKFTIKETKK